jgi:signal transduction histidine kinase
MPARSLRHVLTAQWIGFGLMLAMGFIGLGVLLLFLLEDSFIDRRLRDTATRIVEERAAAVPDRYRIHTGDRLPAELETRMDGARLDTIREFRLQDGRYVHVMWTRGADGQPFALVYDASDDLTVNAGIADGWPYALVLLALLALIAHLLARRFIGQVSHQAANLIRQLHEAEGPDALRHHADHQTIREFAELARLSADAWQARLSALERERATLTYLAHELRTPLQSARVSMALFEDDRGDDRAMLRLRRAIDRLIRASNSLLWFAGDAPAQTTETVAIEEVVLGLIAELEPLAEMRQQSFELRIEHHHGWPLRRDALETLFANLLLNAVQHGDSGGIRIDIGIDSVRIENAANPDASESGFGLGLQIVAHLAERMSLRLSRECADGRMYRVRVECPTAHPIAREDVDL